MMLLGKILDLRAEKAQVISSNIANAETPGYRPAVYDFEQDLRNAVEQNSTINLTTSNSNHIPANGENFNSVTGKIIKAAGSSTFGDGNGVNVEQEMISLSENEILYETSAQLLKKRIGLLKYVISGGQ
jgi:flagellar basal-body rod protein FlgB